MSRDDLVGGYSINGLTIGLKAEVIKKRKEFDQSKSQKGSTSDRLTKPLFTKNKRVKSENKTKKSKHKHNESSNPETKELLDKSRVCLEGKSQFYDKMNKVENFNSAIKHSNSYLVDFESKITDSKLNTPNVDLPYESANTSKISSSTEYRKLASMTETPVISQDILKPFNANDYEHLHYQAAVGKEIREHGVGYFAFSTDEEIRKQQMQDFERIHEETEDNIAKRRKVSEELAAQKAAGIERIRKMENDPEGEGFDMSNFVGLIRNDDKTPVSGMKVSNPELCIKEESTPEMDAMMAREELEKQKQKVFKLIDSIRESTRKPSAREWDRGKRTVELTRYPGEMEDGKNPEFAPPDFYSAVKKQRYFDY